MNIDTILAPIAAVSALAYAGLSTLTLVTRIAPAIEATADAPGTVYPGEMVSIKWTVSKHTDCPGTAARVWIGETGFTLTEPAQPSSLPATQGPTVVSIPTRIPSYAPDGALEMRIEGEYACPGQPPVAYILGPVEMNVVRDGK